jgi:hypothetical protein
MSADTEKLRQVYAAVQTNHINLELACDRLRRDKQIVGYFGPPPAKEERRCMLDYLQGVAYRVLPLEVARTGDYDVATLQRAAVAYAANHPKPANQSEAVPGESVESPPANAIRRHRHKKGDAAEILDSAIDQLIKDGDWSITSKTQLVRHAEVSKSTGIRAMTTPKLAIKYARYRELRGSGRGPEKPTRLKSRLLR